MITRLMDYLCVACGGWFRSSCPHGPSVSAYDYCATCGWWTKDCGH